VKFMKHFKGGSSYKCLRSSGIVRVNYFHELNKLLKNSIMEPG
jgi:hypothetical protein